MLSRYHVVFRVVVFVGEGVDYDGLPARGCYRDPSTEEGLETSVASYFANLLLRKPIGDSCYLHIDITSICNSSPAHHVPLAFCFG